MELLIYMLNAKIDGDLIDFLKQINYKWKLLIFDDERIENAAMFDFDKSYGRYRIYGMADYRHLFVLDNTYVNLDGWQPVELAVCVNFDSNVSGYIKSMVFKNRIDEELKNLLIFIKTKKYQSTCQHYCFEQMYNEYPLVEKEIYETLFSDCLVANLTAEQIRNNWFDLQVLPEIDYQRIKINLDNVFKNKGKEVEYYYIVYAMLLEAFLIKCAYGKKAIHNKIQLFLDKVFENIGYYFENELYLCGLYLDNDEKVKEFFRGMQKGSRKEKFLKALRGMVWDLFHLKTVLEEMEARNIQSKIVFLHCFASYEKGLTELIKVNPIKRILYVEDNAYYKYSNSIFDIPGCEKLRYIYEKRTKHSLVDIKILINSLEEKIEELGYWDCK